jgi:hypothetical protein
MRTMRGRRLSGLIVALATISLESGCSGAHNHSEAKQTRPYTTAGLSSAKAACHQMQVHHYLRAAETINVATKQRTDQWADLAQAVRTVAWSTSWAGDVGPHMSREEASNVIRAACTRVTSQADGAAFVWTP